MARKPTTAAKPASPARSVRATPAPTPPAPTPPALIQTAAPAPTMIAPTDIATDIATGIVAVPKTTHTEVKNTMNTPVKSAEEFVAFSQGNVEAMMKAGQIWAAGVQDLHKTFAATAQAQVEAAVGTIKALSGVKSIQEAMELQTTLARSSMETAMAETGKLTDASVKLAEQALAPITARVTMAVEKFGRVA